MSNGVDPQLAAYADEFLTHRISMFDKDMQICLTGIPRKDDPSRDTHAYFPALMGCCGTLELLGSLYKGNAKCSDVSWVVDYCQDFMTDPSDYSKDKIELLFEVVRHGAAHLGVAKGIAIPRTGRALASKRITWTIDEGVGRPAIQIEPEQGQLTVTARPWACPYEYRLYVYLRSLHADIRDSVLRAGGHRDTVMASSKLLAKFEKAMKAIYPP